MVHGSWWAGKNGGMGFDISVKLPLILAISDSFSTAAPLYSPAIDDFNSDRPA